MTVLDVDAMKEQLVAGLAANEGEDGMDGMDTDALMEAMSHPKAAAVVQSLMELEPTTVQLGEPAPDFSLPWLAAPGPDGSASVTLSDHYGKRPVALIFGSYT